MMPAKEGTIEMNNVEHFSNPLWTYEFLLNELKDIAVFSIDLDLRIIGWSPGVEHLLGYSQSDFIGQDAGVLFTPEDREQGMDRQEFAKALERGRSSDTRWHMRKDGRRIFVDGIVNAVRGADGGHLGYVKSSAMCLRIVCGSESRPQSSMTRRTR
jgi:PAS domain S-box-containing protein